MDTLLLEYLLKENLSSYLFQGNFGLEKENVRVDEKGNLALTPHPKEFGSKLKNPYIKTDFSESQVEVITPVCNTLEEVYSFLENLHNIVSLTLKGEYLWPQSNPPLLPEDHHIPITVYEEDGMEERKYRERLAEKYGRKKQLISGIHYNFSFKEEFLHILHKNIGGNKSFRDFKDDIYIKMTKNFLKYRWFLIYLTGASPVFHNTYLEGCTTISERLDDESFYFKNINSLRNSHCGYKNNEDFIVSFKSLEQYVKSIQQLIDSGKIESASEFYSPIRLKGSSKQNSLENLQKNGIQYLEVRILDLNPLYKNGISLEELYLIHLFMLYMFLKEDQPFNKEEQEISNINHNISTLEGRKKGIEIYNEKKEKISLEEEALKVIENLEQIINILNINVDVLLSVLQSAKEKIINPKKTYSHKIIEEVKEKSYVGFHMERAKAYLEESKEKKFNFIGYEELELSTQLLLLEAVKKGISVEIVDKEDNFIKLQRGEKVEYIKQATKTSKDSYSTVLIMENKVVTKKVLEENNIVVPLGKNYSNIEEAKTSYGLFKNKGIVVKPKSTNFGIGISILKDVFTKKDFEKAIEIAFSHDKTILIEEFIKGKEYRFLVIQDEVVGVLHRVPANVTGDGERNIIELVKEKNKDPLRGKGYKTPLEKIDLGEIEEMFLKNQGKNFEYIPKENEIVFLRENSNISTGGDSIDYTEEVDESYKKIAIQSAKAANAVICGVDMMIDNIKEKQNKDNYAIIELNFNPAIHIHCYPYKGKNRNVAEKILDLLFEK